MDLGISKDEQAFAAGFARFCEERIAPRAQRVDVEGAIPRETWADLREMGYFRLFYPPSVGGLGASWLQQAMAEEALAKACASTYLSTGASVGLCGAPLFFFGSTAQQEKWLAPLLRAERIGCFALTEPGCGTDAAALRTRARPEESGFVLEGEKALITNAPIADVAVVLAVTDPDAGPGGVTMFAVDLHKPGVTRTPPYAKMGLRGSATGGLVFEGVQLGAEDIIGAPGQGFIQAMQTLELGRIGICHFAIGIAEAAYEASMRYAATREAFGRPLARLQTVHLKIADMKVELDAARLMARQCAWRKARGEMLGARASVAKTFATEMAVRVTDAAVQIHGGWGYTSEFVVERLFRDARLGPIGEGTNEIQRELIARALLEESP